MEGGVILERTGIHGSGLGRRVPVMARMAAFRIVSIFFTWELWDHVEEQYSAVEYTRANEVVQSIVAYNPYLIPAFKARKHGMHTQLNSWLHFFPLACKVKKKMPKKGRIKKGAL